MLLEGGEIYIWIDAAGFHQCHHCEGECLAPKLQVASHRDFIIGEGELRSEPSVQHEAGDRQDVI